MGWLLRLVEDTLSDGAVLAFPDDGTQRVVHVVHGGISVEGAVLAPDNAWHGRNATLLAGQAGAALWRFELARAGTQPIMAPHGRTLEKLSTPITLPDAELLLRHDSVAFPPGGCAFLHTHAGPGIRCLIEGGIRIDTDGHSTSHAPGSAWFEAGSEPVFAQAADRPTRFLRVMVLPRRLLGTTSIRYVHDEDRERPKSQSYKGYVDAPITL
jgi:hypothetical protein